MKPKQLLFVIMLMLFTIQPLVSNAQNGHDIICKDVRPIARSSFDFNNKPGETCYENIGRISVGTNVNNKDICFYIRMARCKTFGGTLILIYPSQLTKHGEEDIKIIKGGEVEFMLTDGTSIKAKYFIDESSKLFQPALIMFNEANQNSTVINLFLKQYLKTIRMPTKAGLVEKNLTTEEAKIFYNTINCVLNYDELKAPEIELNNLLEARAKQLKDSVEYSKRFQSRDTCRNAYLLKPYSGEAFYCVKDRIVVLNSEDGEGDVFISKHPGIDSLEFSMTIFDKRHGDTKIVHPDISEDFEFIMEDGTLIKCNNFKMSGVNERVIFTPSNNNVEDLYKLAKGYIRIMKIKTKNGTVTKELTEETRQNFHDVFYCILSKAPFTGYMLDK